MWGCKWAPKGPSQKFAEACETKNVRLGGGEGVSTVFAKQASKKKKKIEQYADNGRCAPLGPDANRLEPNKEILLEQIRIIWHRYSDFANNLFFQTLPVFFCVVSDFPIFLGLLIPNNFWVHSFFFASSEKSKSVLPFLSRMLKPGLRFLFVSGGREGVENETYVLRFASFCELLRRPLNEKNSQKTSLFFSSKAECMISWCLQAVFFLLVLGSPIRKTSGGLSRDCLLETKALCLMN